MLGFLYSNNTPGRVPPVKYHLCWICTSNKYKAQKNRKFPIFSYFLEFTVEQVLKSFSGRNNFPEPHVFGFSNSLPHGLEESREL